MRNTLRTFVVGLLVMVMSLNPATAWHYYYDGCSDCGSYYGPVVYESCGSCETVVCDDCYSDCGSCSDCGPYDGEVIEGAPSEMMGVPAPTVPAETVPPTNLQPAPQPQQPATVDRPVQPAPAPQLPPAPTEDTFVPSPPEPVQPVTPPAEESPDDLFNGTEEATTPPAETPATETPAEETNDLFGEPAESTPPAESAEPAETPATEPSADDLFGEPAATESTDEMPAEETPAEETPADETPAEGETPAEDDDIFGASRGALREPGGLASEDMRLWVDNTGSYSCRGRLVHFVEGQVRLIKDNGRMTTVPLYRLSAVDLEFVHRQASAQQAEAFQTAHLLSAMPWSAN